MSARALPAELAAVRALVTDGLAEIGDAGDTGQVWLRSATARLTALDGVLTEAAGVLAVPTQVLLVTLATFVVVAGSAALAGALGLSSGGILALSGTALLIMLTATPWAGRHVYTLTGRRRLARAAAHLSPPPAQAALPQAGPAPARKAAVPESDLAEVPAPAAPETGPATVPETGVPETGVPETASKAAAPETGLAAVPNSGVPEPGLAAIPDGGMPETGLGAVPDRLLRARVRLVSAALRQVGADSWSAPELRRAIRTDPVVRRLAHADQLLCQAVDCVERHLGDLRKDTL